MVIKRWILSEFSGFGPNGWRDIVPTLDIRDNGCPPIKCDAWQAKKRGALIVDYTKKVVRVSYPHMKEPCQDEENGRDAEHSQEEATTLAGSAQHTHKESK